MPPEHQNPNPEEQLIDYANAEEAANEAAEPIVQALSGLAIKNAENITEKGVEPEMDRTVKGILDDHAVDEALARAQGSKLAAETEDYLRQQAELHPPISVEAEQYLKDLQNGSEVEDTGIGDDAEQYVHDTYDDAPPVNARTQKGMLEAKAKYGVKGFDAESLELPIHEMDQPLTSNERALMQDDSEQAPSSDGGESASNPT